MTTKPDDKLSKPLTPAQKEFIGLFNPLCPDGGESYTAYSTLRDIVQSDLPHNAKMESLIQLGLSRDRLYALLDRALVRAISAAYASLPKPLSDADRSWCMALCRKVLRRPHKSDDAVVAKPATTTPYTLPTRHLAYMRDVSMASTHRFRYYAARCLSEFVDMLHVRTTLGLIPDGAATDEQRAQLNDAVAIALSDEAPGTPALSAEVLHDILGMGSSTLPDRELRLRQVTRDEFITAGLDRSVVDRLMAGRESVNALDIATVTHTPHNCLNLADLMHPGTLVAMLTHPGVTPEAALMEMCARAALRAVALSLGKTGWIAWDTWAWACQDALSCSLRSVISGSPTSAPDRSRLAELRKKAIRCCARRTGSVAVDERRGAAAYAIHAATSYLRMDQVRTGKVIGKRLARHARDVCTYAYNAARCNAYASGTADCHTSLTPWWDEAYAQLHDALVALTRPTSDEFGVTVD